jgi:hypothetical protein
MLTFFRLTGVNEGFWFEWSHPVREGGPNQDRLKPSNFIPFENVNTTQRIARTSLLGGESAH